MNFLRKCSAYCGTYWPWWTFWIVSTIGILFILFAVCFLIGNGY